MESICPFANVAVCEFSSHPHYKDFVETLKRYATESLLDFGKSLHTDELTEEGVSWIAEMAELATLSTHDKVCKLGVYFIGDMMCAEFNKKEPNLHVIEICAQMIKSTYKE